MQKRSLQKLGGLAVITGSLLLAAWAFFWTALLPAFGETGDFYVIVKDPDYVWIAALALVALILLIFGFTAVYATIYDSSGITGLLGYVSITLAYFFEAAQVTWEAFVYPAVASHGPSIPLFSDAIFFKHGQVVLFHYMSLAAILIGITLFCYVLVKSREFPKAGGILIFGGAMVYAAGPMINVYLAVAGVVILAAGCFIIGSTMIKETDA
ncbi:MAG: hypothetical protein JW803_02575 [Endomicrobiales bacterium]|nr:hypothetical protein [Endomicrobiales bacterium]